MLIALERKLSDRVGFDGGSANIFVFLFPYQKEN
jgi:hypothetical protein